VNLKSGLWVSTASSQYPCDLRLEILKASDGSDGNEDVAIVSGDLRDGDKPHWFLSAQRSRSRQPVRLTGGAHPHIDADVRFGPRNFMSGRWGSLALDFSSSKRATLHLTGPGGLDATVPLRWKQQEFRDITIELDKLASLPFPSEIRWRNVARDLKRVLRAAGFKAKVIRSNRSVPDDAGGWTAGELHDALTTYRRATPGPWHVHVFLASNYQPAPGEDNGDTLGLMFDAFRDDVNGIPREGCAVFIDAHERFVNDMRGATWEGDVWTNPEALEREILMTVVHEIGHNLNLVHSFDSDKGRPDSPSIMNYPHKYDYGEPQYYDAFDFAFDPPELVHLRHHTPIVVEPGRIDGQQWGRDLFREPPSRLPEPAHDARAAEASRTRFMERLERNNAEARQDLQLVITLPESALVSEPVVAAVTVTNKSDRGVAVNASLDWKAGELAVEMRSRGGTEPWRVIHPPVLRCVRARPKAIAPGASLTVPVPIILSRDGDPLRKAGDYEVRAALRMQRSGTWVQVFALPTNLTISEPTTRRDRQLVRLYRTRQLKSYLLIPEARLSDTARRAAERLHSLAPERQAGRLATLSLVREAVSRVALDRPIPEAFRNPEYLRRALVAVSDQTPSGAPLERAALETQSLLARRSARIEMLGRTKPAAADRRSARGRRSTRPPAAKRTRRRRGGG
jgi:hypothetical protein